MKKIFLKYYESIKGYNPFEKSQTMNFLLQNLHFSLRQELFEKLKKFKKENGSIQWEWIELAIVNDNIILWDTTQMKPMADVKFTAEYFNTYSEYSDKRWDDMQKLEMSLKNYEKIINKWEVIKKTKPEYIIFSQDDAGYVDLVGKAELSREDLVDMKLEHERYLKYEEAWKKYERANPNRSEVWRSPADSEFEADWQKYLED